MMDPITLTSVLPVAIFIIISLSGALLGVLTWIAKQTYEEIKTIKKMFFASQLATMEKIAGLDNRVTALESILDSPHTHRGK